MSAGVIIIWALAAVVALGAGLVTFFGGEESGD